MCRHEVIGVFMRNWDESEERGESACSAEADWTDAQHVASHLSIPIHEADFVRQYWTQVFSEFVAQVTFDTHICPFCHRCMRSVEATPLLGCANGLYCIHTDAL